MDRRIGILVSLALLLPVLVTGQKRTTGLAFVSVTAAGSSVADLTAADFDLSAGGAKQTVTRVTYNPAMRIVLLVDASTSISDRLTSFRQGLQAFLDAAPPEAEIALLSIAGQIGIRQAPTKDRAKLQTAVDHFASSGGGNAFLEVLLETDQRFLRNDKNGPDRWPMLVILTTDSGEMVGTPNVEPFNAFAQDFRLRGGTAHAIVIHGTTAGLISDLAMNLAQNTGGTYDPLAMANALPDKMKALATRIAADRQSMAGRYTVEYTADAKAAQQPIDLKVLRPGVNVQVSPRRPF